MKIKILEGVGYRGDVLAAGAVVDVEAQDFLDLLQSGRAVAVNVGDHAVALDTATRAALRLERARHWRQ